MPYICQYCNHIINDCNHNHNLSHPNNSQPQYRNINNRNNNHLTIDTNRNYHHPNNYNFPNSNGRAKPRQNAQNGRRAQSLYNKADSSSYVYDSAWFACGDVDDGKEDTKSNKCSI